MNISINKRITPRFINHKRQKYYYIRLYSVLILRLFDDLYDLRLKIKINGKSNIN